ncbi:hypothetical protein AA313_de0200153 [Arthrobotrys entomopaga]|nr:hypothetical protein AA313_de0200153 [Arthrobotrys entomopaga]
MHEHACESSEATNVLNCDGMAIPRSSRLPSRFALTGTSEVTVVNIVLVESGVTVDVAVVIEMVASGVTVAVVSETETVARGVKVAVVSSVENVARGVKVVSVSVTI